MTIAAATQIGFTVLTVPDLDRSITFYTEIIGLTTQERAAGNVVMGTTGGVPLVVLRERRDITPHDPRAVGLFHFAILVPSRLDLARTLRHLALARYPLQGSADHLVSEALYLGDPDGNGIEIYRDRPRTEWPRIGDQIQIGTEPLDIAGLRAVIAADDRPWEGLEPGTVLGHMHLQVGELATATRFYTDILGFTRIIQMPTAAFVSAGGYHHHVGINTWASRGRSHPGDDMAGLLAYSIVLPDAAARDAVVQQLHAHDVPTTRWGDRVLVRDGAGNGVILTIDQAIMPSQIGDLVETFAGLGR